MIAGTISARDEGQMIAIIYQLALNGLKFAVSNDGGDWVIEVERPT
jgi:hypothetical protein